MGLDKGLIPETIEYGDEISLGLAEQILSILESERVRMAAGVSRESNIALVGMFLFGSFLLLSPILSLLAIPIIAYGLFTFWTDRKELTQLRLSLKVAQSLLFKLKTV